MYPLKDGNTVTNNIVIEHGNAVTGRHPLFPFGPVPVPLVPVL